MRVIGAGLACLDIINEGKKISIMNGGTCANVMTALAQLGEDATMLLPDYINDIHKDEFYLTFKRLNVDLLFYGKTKQKIPRIVETYDDKHRHLFYTKCPQCKKNLIKNRFLTKREIKVLPGVFKEYEVFFTDRISDGIKEIAKEMNTIQAKVFYEPNSGRNLNALVEMAKLSNVLKFSTERISMSLAEEVLAQCQDSILEVVIATHGKKGLSYCCKMNNGKFSDWIEGPHINFKRVKDTSGAGDWLTAGFLHYWSREQFELSNSVIYNTLEKSLKLSEIASMTQGAQGVFYDKEIFEMLKEEYKVKIENPLEQYRPHFEGNKHCEFCLSEYDE